MQKIKPLARALTQVSFSYRGSAVNLSEEQWGW